jgi:hypothetical protein
MKLNQACRLLGARVEELTGEAEKVQVGLSGLLAAPSPLGPDKAVEGCFGEAAVWIGDALSDMAERLRRLNEVIAELKGKSAIASAAHRRGGSN